MSALTRTLCVAFLVGGAVLLAVQPVTAQGRRGGRGGGPQASPAAAYRINIMRGFQSYQGMLRAVTDGDAGSPSHAAALARGWVALASTLPEAFPAGSAGEGSRALPAIWEQPDEFATRVAALRTALDALAAAAESGDMAAITAAAAEVNPACGGCHMPFRAAAGRGGGTR